MTRLKKLNNKSGVQSYGYSYFKQEPIVMISLCVMLMICMYPEISLATASLEGQVEKVGGLGNGKIKTVGITLAGVSGGIWSIATGNLKRAGTILAIGVIVALFLEWVNGGMKLMNA